MNRLLLIALFICANVFAQPKLFRFIEKETNKPIPDADVYTDSVFVGATNYNGNIKIDVSGSYKNVIVNHVAYEKRIIPRDSLAVRKVYTIKKLDYVLDEVVVDSRTDKDSTTSLYGCFSYGMKIASPIKAFTGEKITILKFRVTNTQGVKGLNFLPFKANVYVLDSVTKLPLTPLLPEDITVENKSGATWATTDISKYDVKVPKQGACVVFIIPQTDFIPGQDGFYKTFTVLSKVGAIAAVPYLKWERTSHKNSGFIYDSFVDMNTGITGSQMWKRIRDARYIMETETQKSSK
nr:hypothetical protein [uncultured Flavobacterium sp.]